MNVEYVESYVIVIDVRHIIDVEHLIGFRHIIMFGHMHSVDGNGFIW